LLIHSWDNVDGNLKNRK